MKYIIAIVLATLVVACAQNNNTSTEKADMYEASELSAMMREMVEFSKAAKQTLAKGDTIQEVPASFYDLAKQHGTRDEHLENSFQSLAPAYTDALRGIERKDSQQYYYDASIQACKNCHGVYCGGPLAIINQL